MQHNSILDGKMTTLKVQDKPVDKNALVDNSKRRGFLKNQKDQNKGRNNNPESAANELPPVKDSNKKKIDFK